MNLHIEESVDAGVRRKVLYHLADTPTLGVLLLHPTGGTGKASLLGGRWHEQAGISVCAPEALGFDPSRPADLTNPRAWSSRCGPMAQREFDDTAYLLSLAASFKQSLPEDTPLCLVGHSNGCAIGFNQLLNRDDHPFDAAALYAANWAHPRTTVKSIPLLYMAGDQDPIYPWNESRQVDTPWFAYQTVPTGPTIQAWLAATGLADTAEELSGVSEDFDWTRWSANDGQIFEFRLLRNQGHHWPAGLPLDPRLQQVLGPNNEALNATSMARSFFDKHLAQQAA